MATNQALRKAKDGMAKGNGGSGGDLLVERCLQCEAGFSDVNDLIEHVEKVHERAVESRGQGRLYWA